MTIKLQQNYIRLALFIALLCNVFQASAQTISAPQVSNKEIAVQYINEVINNQKLYLLKYIFDTGYVFHSMSGKDGYEMRDSALNTFLYGLFTAFPDFHFTLIQYNIKFFFIKRCSGIIPLLWCRYFSPVI